MIKNLMLSVAIGDIWGSIYEQRFGNRFRLWLMDEHRTPYVSQGTNGSAMRCMAAGLLAKNEEECKEMAFRIAEPTNNHPDSVRGAEAIAMGIYHTLRGKDKDFVRQMVSERVQ